MNGAALKVIQRTLNLSFFPTAVQGRVFGSKGLWTLEPSTTAESLKVDSEPPRIWIRKSQQKIKLVVDENVTELSMEMYEVHRAHFIFDLVAVSRVGMNAHLSKHTIINLNHNGVPLRVFKTIMEKNVEREMKPLTQFEGQHATPLLWHAVNNAAKVSTARMQDYVTRAQRVLGLAGRWESDNDMDAVDTDEAVPFLLSSAPARYYPGGRPISKAERVLRLLQAGFTLDEEYLFSELLSVQDNVLSAMLDKLRLPMSGSAEGFMIPGMYPVIHDCIRELIQSYADPSGKLRQAAGV